MAGWHIARTSAHSTWDRSLPPVHTVAPGDTVALEVSDASGGQLGPDSDAIALNDLDMTRVNPVTGPLFVDGARPGDAVVVEVESIEPEDWGWTANIPGFGLLADDFPEPYLRISKVTGDGIELFPGFAVPLCPMIGTIGLAPPEPGPHPIIPPSRWGGNMDIRHLGPGTRLWLPVGVEGALLSLGDTHAAQGDGEVCGTAIETGSVVHLRIDVDKDAQLPRPRLTTNPDAPRSGRALATTGIGPDLFAAARDATRYMIDEVCRRTGLEAVEAYLLVSVAGDMKVSEIVDQPNWVVTVHVETDLLGL